MRIAKVEVFHVRVPMKNIIGSSHGKRSDHDSIITKIWTDEGDYGIGAVDPHFDGEEPVDVKNTLRSRLVPKILQQDPSQIWRILKIMDAEVVGHLLSKAAIEMGLFDLLGKTLKTPVHTLLGGKIKESILLNGWIGLVNPDEAKQDAIEFVEKGFRSLKIKIDANLAATKERIEAVRTTVGDGFQIRIDANEALNLVQAKETATALSAFNIFYLEQPMPAELREAFSTLSDSCPVRLMADESIHDTNTLLQILKGGGAQYVKVKIQKMGGFLKTVQAIHVAQAFRIPVILGHGFGLTVNTLAELHLAATSDAIIDGCEAVGPMKMADDIVNEPLIMDGGAVTVPNLPGLGIELDEEKMQRYRV